MLRNASRSKTVRLSLKEPPAPSGLASAARIFRRDKALHLPALVDRKLLGVIDPEIKKAVYIKRRYGFARELLMKENRAWNLLHFLMNGESALKAFRRITGNSHLKFFTGRVYKMLPARHYLEWHDDLKYNRLCALSINLSPAAYRGGRLELRERKSGRIIFRSPALKPGDGILFSISPRFEHRLTAVRGKRAKIAYAGWFYRKPENRWFAKNR